MTAVTQPALVTLARAPISDAIITTTTHTKSLEPEADSSAISSHSCNELSDPLPPTPSGPRLPIAILERIIDCIAIDYDLGGSPVYWTFKDVHPMLLALCLVSQALVLRCRLYLYRNITLRNEQDLQSVAAALSHHPSLIAHIHNLVIDARHPQAGSPISQSWISAVPLSLPIARMESLPQLWLDSVDLTQLHPSFYALCARFAKVHCLVLIDVRYTRYSQLTRLVRAVQTGVLMCVFDFDSAAILSAQGLGLHTQPPLPSSAGRLLFPHCMDAVYWSLTWDALDHILQTLLSEEDCTPWPCATLDLKTNWPPRGGILSPYGVVLEKLVLFNQRLLHNGQRCSIQLTSGPFKIYFYGERVRSSTLR